MRIAFIQYKVFINSFIISNDAARFTFNVDMLSMPQDSSYLDSLPIPKLLSHFGISHHVTALHLLLLATKIYLNPFQLLTQNATDESLGSFPLVWAAERTGSNYWVIQ